MKEYPKPARKLTLRRPPRNPDDETRRLLALGTLLLIPVDLGIYVATRDVGVLAGTTIIGIAVYAVFRYYFTR